jgi:hypothetical protein
MARPSIPETTAKKFVLTLNADGTAIDWAGNRESTKERFISLVKGSSDVLTAIDRQPQCSEGNAPEVNAAFTQETTRVALDLLGTINAFALRLAVAKMVKHPFKADDEGRKLPFVIDPDIATSAFQLTPEQHAELDPRLEKKLNELKLPDFLEKNLDWYLIGATYVKYCGENAKTAMGQQLARDLQVRGREEFLKNNTANKNPKPDSDAKPRTSNTQHMNGKAQPEEFQRDINDIPDMDGIRPNA